MTRLAEEGKNIPRQRWWVKGYEEPALNLAGKSLRNVGRAARGSATTAASGLMGLGGKAIEGMGSLPTHGSLFTGYKPASPGMQAFGKSMAESAGQSGKASLQDLGASFNVPAFWNKSPKAHGVESEHLNQDKARRDAIMAREAQLRPKGTTMLIPNKDVGAVARGAETIGEVAAETVPFLAMPMPTPKGVNWGWQGPYAGLRGMATEPIGRGGLAGLAALDAPITGAAVAGREQAHQQAHTPTWLPGPQQDQPLSPEWLNPQYEGAHHDILRAQEPFARNMVNTMLNRGIHPDQIESAVGVDAGFIRELMQERGMTPPQALPTEIPRIQHPDAPPPSDDWEQIMGHRLNKQGADRLPGGHADNKPTSKYRKDQVSDGVKVEMEHTNDKKLSKEITKDHLEEHPDYYTRLKNMEERADAGMAPVPGPKQANLLDSVDGARRLLAKQAMAAGVPREIVEQDIKIAADVEITARKSPVVHGFLSRMIFGKDELGAMRPKDRERVQRIADYMTASQPAQLETAKIFARRTDPAELIKQIEAHKGEDTWMEDVAGTRDWLSGEIANINPTAMEQMGASYWPHANSVVINERSPGALIHELGHGVDLARHKDQSKLRRWLRWKFKPQLWGEFSAWRKGRKAYQQGAAADPELTEDSEAMKEYQENMKSYQGRKFPAFGTYLGGATGTLAGLGAGIAGEVAMEGATGGNIAILGAALGGALGVVGGALGGKFWAWLRQNAHAKKALKQLEKARQSKGMLGVREKLMEIRQNRQLQAKVQKEVADMPDEPQNEETLAKAAALERYAMNILDQIDALAFQKEAEGMCPKCGKHSCKHGKCAGCGKPCGECNPCGSHKKAAVDALLKAAQGLAGPVGGAAAGAGAPAKGMVSPEILQQTASRTMPANVSPAMKWDNRQWMNRMSAAERAALRGEGRKAAPAVRAGGGGAMGAGGGAAAAQGTQYPQVQKTLQGLTRPQLRTRTGV